MRQQRIGAFPAAGLLLLWGAACGANAAGAAPEDGARSPGAVAGGASASAPIRSMLQAANAASAEITVPTSEAPPAPAPPLPSANLTPAWTPAPPTPEVAPEPPRPDTPAPASVRVGACSFGYLGAWTRCEHAGWPNVVETSAPDLQSCMQLCLERDDCSAVTDYLWLGLPELGCDLYISSCDAPEMPAWAEEDGGRDYRKVCPTGADAGPAPVPSATAAADAGGP